MKFVAPHHLIFEGAELTGKSYIISQIYDWLEKKYSSKDYPHLLDGCFWLNSDIGVFGLPVGKKIIANYLKLAQNLKNYNLIFEKFHITDQVYNSLYNQLTIDYRQVEKELKILGFKIIFLQIKEDEKIFANRLKDRLDLYSHYERIAQTPVEYLKQQTEYKKFMAKSSLPVLTVDSTKLPNHKIIKEILTWLKEK